jgi:hypothetical protein
MNRLWAALKKESALPQLSSDDESFLAAPILQGYYGNGKLPLEICKENVTRYTDRQENRSNTAKSLGYMKVDPMIALRAEWGSVRLPSARFILVNLPALHHEHHFAHGRNVLHGVAIHCDDVGLHARSDCADFILHV